MTPSRPPSLIPQADKTQENQRVQLPRRRLFSTIALLLLLLLTVALGSIAILLVNSPGTLGLALEEDIEATRVVFQQREDALQGTADTLLLTAQFQSDAAFNNESTQAALMNLQQVVDQQGTQAALDVDATQTGIAVENARQGTQSALDFEGTRVAFQRQATQAELDFQGTQAALNREATAAVLGFATRAPSGEDILSQTPPPTITAQPLFTDGFASGVGGGLWQFSNVNDWGLAEDGILTARGVNNWLLTQQTDLTGYILEIALSPLQGLESYSYVLLNIPDGEMPGYMLELYHTGEVLQAAGLYPVTQVQILAQAYLTRTRQDIQAIQSIQTNIPQTEARLLNIRVEVREARLVAVVNEQLLLDLTLPEAPKPGAVGVYVPTGTRIQRITLLP